MKTAHKRRVERNLLKLLNADFEITASTKKRRLKKLILINLGVKTVLETRRRCRKRNWRRPVSKVSRQDTTRNWLDLPQDVLSLICMKLPLVELLLSARLVCSSWRKVSTEPHLFHSIEIGRPITRYFRYFDEKLFNAFVKIAVEGSRGQIVKFTCESELDSNLEKHVFKNFSSDMRSLCIKSLTREFGALLETKSLSQLEELRFHDIDGNCLQQIEMLEQIGRCCQKLKYLRWDLELADWAGREPVESDCVDGTFAIAKNMPQLHRLHLTESIISNDVLQLILDGCPLLEHIILRTCCNVDSHTLLKRPGVSSRIREIKVWDASDHDYEFELKICNVRSTMSESQYQEFIKIYDSDIMEEENMNEEEVGEEVGEEE